MSDDEEEKRTDLPYPDKYPVRPFSSSIPYGPKSYYNQVISTESSQNQVSSKYINTGDEILLCAARDTSHKIKLIADFFRKLHHQLEDGADFEPKVCFSWLSYDSIELITLISHTILHKCQLLSKFSQKFTNITDNSNSRIESVPADFRTLNSSVIELWNSTVTMLQALISDTTVRKAMYESQLKKTRDNSNAATRNAIMVC